MKVLELCFGLKQADPQTDQEGDGMKTATAKNIRAAFSALAGNRKLR